jgi:MYXO-CTERM domain-containing protein
MQRRPRVLFIATVWAIGFGARDLRAAGGDACNSATKISALPFVDADGDSCGLDDTFDNTGAAVCSDLPDAYPGPDAFYVVTLGANNQLSFELSMPSGATGDLALFLFRGSPCGVTGSCAGNSVDVIGAGEGPEHIASQRYPAGTYYVVVDSALASGNAASCGAYALTVSGSLGDVTSTGGSGSGGAASGGESSGGAGDTAGSGNTDAGGAGEGGAGIAEGGAAGASGPGAAGSGGAETGEAGAAGSSSVDGGSGGKSGGAGGVSQGGTAGSAGGSGGASAGRSGGRGGAGGASGAAGRGGGAGASGAAGTRSTGDAASDEGCSCTVAGRPERPVRGAIGLGLLGLGLMLRRRRRS